VAPKGDVLVTVLNGNRRLIHLLSRLSGTPVDRRAEIHLAPAS